MALSQNGQIRDDTNWLMVVSDELRAWWEVINPPPARNPDPLYVMPPPLVSLRPAGGVTVGESGVTIDTKTLLLIGAVIVAVVLLK